MGEEGRLHVPTLSEAPTLQYGPSALLDTLVRAADRRVGIYSGLVTDAVTALARDGRLRAPAVTGYLWGGDGLDDMARDGALRLAAVDETHDVSRIAAIPQFVACNTALQMGLDCSVSAERIRTRAGDEVVGGIAGHPDFARGAAAGFDARSVIAMRASHRGRSNVVPFSELPTVTTARTDVDLVVTEHGVADVRGRTDAERARLLRDIAPDGDEGES